MRAPLNLKLITPESEDAARPVRFLQVAQVVLLILFAFDALADGRCKKDGIPPGFLAAGEFRSFECYEANPTSQLVDEPNAWELAEITDGAKGCLVGRSASLIECETISSADCPTRSAKVMRTPLGCLDVVAHTNPPDLKGVCTVDTYKGYDPLHWIVVGRFSLPLCVAPDHPDAYLVRKIASNPGTMVNRCSMPETVLPPGSVILGHFESTACPENYFELNAIGPDSIPEKLRVPRGYNVDVVGFVPNTSNSQTFYVCEDSPLPHNYRFRLADGFLRPIVKPRSHVSGGHKRTPTRLPRATPPSPPPLKTFHVEDCGSDGENAKEIYWDPTVSL